MAHLGIGKEKSGRRNKSGKEGKCEEAMETPGQRWSSKPEEMVARVQDF